MSVSVTRIHEKSEWPEVLGLNATIAATMIARDRPEVAVEVLPPGTTVIPGYDPKRVRVYINSSGHVAHIPMIG